MNNKYTVAVNLNGRGFYVAYFHYTGALDEIRLVYDPQKATVYDNKESLTIVDALNRIDKNSIIAFRIAHE